MIEHRPTLKVSISCALGLGLLLGLLTLLRIPPTAVRAASAPNDRAEGTTPATSSHPLEPAAPSLASGTVITVCPGGGCDFVVIQDAVDFAAPGDEIRVAAGTYTGVSARAGITQLVYISKTVTIRGGYTTANWDEPDPLANPTTLDAQGQGRVLAIVPGPDAGAAISPTIIGLRVTGGDATGLGGGLDWLPDAGGGIYVIDASATISGNHILSNAAQCGGGIYVARSHTVLRDNEISGNVAAYGGGVGMTEGTPSLWDNVVTGNSAGWGGGLYAYDDAGAWERNLIVDNAASDGGGGTCLHASGGTLTANTFSGNTAPRGAGLYVYQSTALMKENAVTGNTASIRGGGLYVRDSGGTVSGGTVHGNHAKTGAGLYLQEGQMVVSQVNVAGNSAAEWGGGVWISSADAMLSGNAISANVASKGGGGIALVRCEARLASNRITGNSAEQGGGIYILESASTMTNTLLAENGAQGWGSGIFVTGGSDVTIRHATLVGNGWDAVSADGAGSLSEPTDGTALEVRDGSTVALTNTILVGHEVGVYAANGAQVTLEATLLGDGPWANGLDYAGQGTIIPIGDVVGDPGFLDSQAGDYRIGLGSAAVDRGVDAGVDHDIDGLPRPLPPGGAFDLGASEFTGIDLSPSTKRVEAPEVAVGAPLTYTISLLNRGWQTATPTVLFDPIPEHTVYVSGTAYATDGALSDAAGIHWTGTLAPHRPVTIGFQVTVTAQAIIRNVAVITDPYGVTSSLTASAAPWRTYLPLIVKNWEPTLSP